MNHKIPLVVIVGATGVGKTDLALESAEELNAEIISADSRLFYRGMDIGTAKPSLEEQRRVRHHLIDIANPDEIISLGMYQELVVRCIQDINQRGKLAMMVGGTGQYIRAITEGWTVPEVVPDPGLRKQIEAEMAEKGLGSLTQRLEKLDPEYYAIVDRNNHRRIIRALEVILTTGKRMSTQRGKTECPYDVIMIGLTRERNELYARIDQRIDQMIQYGFVDEVRKLLSCGYDPGLPSMSAIGYGEIVCYLQGKYTLDEAITLIKKRTRILVRRQNNWFKPSDENIHWIKMDDQRKFNLIDTVLSQVNRELRHAE